MMLTNNSGPSRRSCGGGIAALEGVFRSGWLLLGNEVQQFEQPWAKFYGAKFCIGVASVMEAIELGLRALNIGPADEVMPVTATATRRPTDLDQRPAYIAEMPLCAIYY